MKGGGGGNVVGNGRWGSASEEGMGRTRSFVRLHAKPRKVETSRVSEWGVRRGCVQAWAWGRGDAMRCDAMDGLSDHAPLFPFPPPHNYYYTFK